MNYVLDTNVVIAFLNERPLAVRPAVETHLRRGERLLLSSIVLFELWYGAAKSRWRTENAERLAVLTRGMLETLPFEEEDARIAGELRTDLERRGLPIGPYDLLIAAQALRHQAILVTSNEREFTHVLGLQLENWAASPSR